MEIDINEILSKIHQSYLFIEGVFAGVYGNWLILMAEKISFGVEQPINYFIYAITLITFCWFFKETFNIKINIKFRMGLYLIHSALIILLWVISNQIYLTAIGLSIWVILCYVDTNRIYPIRSISYILKELEKQRENK